jgi:hypothetical protein
MGKAIIFTKQQQEKLRYGRFHAQMSNLFYLIKSLKEDFEELNGKRLDLEKELLVQYVTKRIARKKLIEMEIKSIMKRMDMLKGEMKRLRCNCWNLLSDNFPGTKLKECYNHIDCSIDKHEFDKLIISSNYLE